MYQRRWLVLLTVGALNLGNNALWIRNIDSAYITLPHAKDSKKYSPMQAYYPDPDPIGRKKLVNLLVN